MLLAALNYDINEKSIKIYQNLKIYILIIPIPQSLRPERFDDGSWDWDNAEREARHIYETYYHIRK